MFDTNVIYESTPVESDRHLIPDDLEMIPPGPILAGYIYRIDRSRLNGHDLIKVLRAEGRLASHYQAQQLSTMAELAYCPPGGPQAEVVRDPVEVEFASTEIGAALHLTRNAADSQLSFALQLRERLPRVWDLLHCGDIDVRRAYILVDGTDHLTEETARHVVDRIVDAAPRLTTGQLAARIRRMCVQTDPAEAQTRYEEALSERRVFSQADVEGTASLFGLKLEPTG